MAEDYFELEYPPYDPNICPTRENYWKAKLIIQRYETYQYNKNACKDVPTREIERPNDRQAMVQDAITLAMAEGVMYGRICGLVDLIQEFAIKTFSTELPKEYYEKLDKTCVAVLNTVALQMHSVDSMIKLKNLIDKTLQEVGTPTDEANNKTSQEEK